jgi:hypothetical protein
MTTSGTAIFFTEWEIIGAKKAKLTTSRKEAKDGPACSKEKPSLLKFIRLDAMEK